MQSPLPSLVSQFLPPGESCQWLWFSFQSYSIIYTYQSLCNICLEVSCPGYPHGSALTGLLSEGFPDLSSLQMAVPSPPPDSLYCPPLLNPSPWHLLPSTFYLISHLMPHRVVLGKEQKLFPVQGFPCTAITATSPVPRTVSDTQGTLNITRNPGHGLYGQTPP